MAHNEQAAGNLARDLASMHCSGSTRCVFGCFADKDGPAMVRALAQRVDLWYPTQPGGGRDLPAVDLAALLARQGVEQAPLSPDASAALERALADAGPRDRVLVTGSFLTVAAAMRKLDLSDRQAGL